MTSLRIPALHTADTTGRVLGLPCKLRIDPEHSDSVTSRGREASPDIRIRICLQFADDMHALEYLPPPLHQRQCRMS